MGCFLCNFNRDKNMQQRTFYQNERWFAFLSAPPHTRDHAILAARRRNRRCPQKFDKDTLGGLDAALIEVVKKMRKCYTRIKHEHILLASLRGDTPHFHIHILPLRPKEYNNWKRVTGYPGSHLMEFLGSLEKKHDFLQLDDLVEKNKEKRKKKEEEQRRKSTKELLGEINRLR